MKKATASMALKRYELVETWHISVVSCMIPCYNDSTLSRDSISSVSTFRWFDSGFDSFFGFFGDRDGQKELLTPTDRRHLSTYCARGGREVC